MKRVSTSTRIGDIEILSRSINVVELRNNAALISKAAIEFEIPTIPTTVAATTFFAPMFDGISNAFSSQKMIERTTMKTWEDKNVIAEINRIGKIRLVLAGFWTSVCIVGPTLSALEQGFEVYVITDLRRCHQGSPRARGAAEVQAGARPMTSVQYLLELQRDWARSELRAKLWQRRSPMVGATASD